MSETQDNGLKQVQELLDNVKVKVDVVKGFIAETGPVTSADAQVINGLMARVIDAARAVKKLAAELRG